MQIIPTIIVIFILPFVLLNNYLTSQKNKRIKESLPENIRKIYLEDSVK